MTLKNRSKPHVSNSLRHKGPEIWCSISEEINRVKTIKSFSKHLKKQLNNKYEY